MIPVHGYACKQAKGPLTSYAFERREPRDHDVVIDIQVPVESATQIFTK